LSIFSNAAPQAAFIYVKPGSIAGVPYPDRAATDNAALIASGGAMQLRAALAISA
jgi:hypothetical protein